jgi:peptide/nickel transport system substrate-binding protein
MKRNLLVLSTVLFVLSLTLNSYAAPEGTIRIASPAATAGSGFTYESTDPIFWEPFWGWAMYDALLTLDPQGNPVGVVAESWSISPDGNTWTFKIRKGIKFHNGDPLTSADVKFSVDRFATKESTNPWSPYLRNNYASTSTLDDYTFIYKTVKPEPQLVMPFMYARILPKNYFEKIGQDAFRKAPIGSGPWKFVKLVHSTSFEMEANTNHWRQVPAFKTVIDLSVPEEATRVAMLKSGEVDIATDLTIDRIVEFQKLGYTLQEVGLNTLFNISFPGTWATDSPTSDIRVRQAMSYAINRQEICDTYFKGMAKPGGRWFINENGWAWDPSWKPDPYDVAKAKQLLANAGYPGKFKNPEIQVYAQAGPQADLMQMLQGYWAAVGIQTKITIIDSVTYAGLFFKGNRNPEAKNMGAVIPWLYPTLTNSVYHSANMYTSKGVHSTGNDPKADELYNKAVWELDPVKAKQYYTDFLNYAYNMWVNVGILQRSTSAPVGPKLGAFTNYKALGLYYLLSGIQHPKK